MRTFGRATTAAIVRAVLTFGPVTAAGAASTSSFAPA